jgi:hypothetical protein
MTEFDYVRLRDGEKMDTNDYNKLNDDLRLSSIDYWRLCDELSVIQAALLVVGEDPSTSHTYVESWAIETRPNGYEAAKTAITHALKKELIVGTLVPNYEQDINGNICGEIEGTVDIRYSTVDVDSLRNWLRGRGFTRGFFFPTETDTPDYLNPNHPRYPTKLAAAINAWLAVTDPKKTSPKKALEKWLRENAAKFSMTDDDGNPIAQAIEDCSKIANWQLTGGAPKSSSD